MAKRLEALRALDEKVAGSTPGRIYLGSGLFWIGLIVRSSATELISQLWYSYYKDSLVCDWVIIIIIISNICPIFNFYYYSVSIFSIIIYVIHIL